MDEKNAIIFEKTIGAKGNATGVSLPNELLNWMDLENGTQVKVAGFEGKYGKYIAVWRKDQSEHEVREKIERESQ